MNASPWAAVAGRGLTSAGRPRKIGVFPNGLHARAWGGDTMADVRAFRAFRYDLGRVGNLSDVVAPPYDVVDPALQQALYDRSSYNAIRLELNKPEGGDAPDDRYARAARLLRDWQRDGVLKQDSARGLYVCHQEYEVEGKRFTRRGVLARVGLEPF